MSNLVAELHSVSFTYLGSDEPALRDIDLELFNGEFVVVTGPSGCGKSTLALCMAGFIPAAYEGELSGTIEVCGRRPTNGPLPLAGRVGLVQQDPEAQLCTLEVEDEVAFGPENLRLQQDEIQERLQWALEVVDATSLVGRSVHTLSGGEKQRIAIASLLAMRPRLLILDEPTTHLDPSGQQAVVDALVRLREQEDTTIVVIEHHLRGLTDVASRQLVMREGAIEADRSNIWTPGWSAPEGEKAPEASRKGSPLLSIKGLSAGYDGRTVLRDISLDGHSGETVAIMGANGCGKSTLLLALLGVVPAAEGTIIFRGEEITELPVVERARHMGLAFQNPTHQLFARTVSEEAVLPSEFLHEGKKEDIEALLTRFGLPQYRDRPPYALSLGEKKRLALVSLLAYAPQVLLLDEPLFGQDPSRVVLLREVLNEHSARGGLSLVVTHNPTFVQRCCDRLVFLDDGMVVLDEKTGTAFDRLCELGLGQFTPVGREEL